MCKIAAINGKWHMYRAICGKQNAKYAEFCIFCEKNGKKVKDINDKDRYNK